MEASAPWSEVALAALQREVPASVRCSAAFISAALPQVIRAQATVADRRNAFE